MDFHKLSLLLGPALVSACLNSKIKAPIKAWNLCRNIQSMMLKVERLQRQKVAVVDDNAEETQDEEM